MPYEIRNATARARASGIYPNPFFDILDHYIPKDLKSLFEWFEYVYFSNPIIASALQKFSMYPITELVFDHEDQDVVDEYREHFEEIRWKELAINAGLEYLIYGNSFTVAFRPVIKEIICDSCGNIASLIQVKKFKLGSNPEKGEGVCPKCSSMTTFTVKDVPKTDLKVTLWNPKLISITRHPLTGEEEYCSDIPATLKDGILTSNSFIINSTPISIIKAVKEGKLITFKNNSIFHLRRGALSGRFQEWGISALMPVLKHLFLIQVYRKANEAIALDHILPLRIIFPQPVTANSDPAVAINLKEFRELMKEVIEQWRRDPNTIMTSPIPIGETQIGGTGKLLDVTPIIQQLTQEVLVGLGVPQEFVFGGLTWSGSSVSLRMLENQLFNYTSQINRLLQWLADKISDVYSLPRIKVKLKPFKMADDVQQKDIALRAGSAGFISRRTLLEELGYDYDKEMERLKEEMLEAQNMSQIFGLQDQEGGEEGEQQPIQEGEEELFQEQGSIEPQPEVYPPNRSGDLL